MTTKHILRVLVLLLTISQLSLSLPLFWPQPQSFSYNESSQPLTLSPCDINYVIESSLSPYIESVINFYLESVFKCTERRQSNVSLHIVVNGRTINAPLELYQEWYSLIIRQSQRWELTSTEYTGFLRGIQTFSQLFEKNNSNYQINGIPILIDDEPQFKWRGLMIDSSRHFLPVETIKHTIDGLLFNKMNVLHWHLTDSESFPFQVPTVFELSTSGMVGGTYSPAEVEGIIEYARMKGVRVVVEIDTPGHTQSWGRSNKYKDIVVKCDEAYDGQFDPTLNLTYQVVGKVMEYLNKVFDDPYVHFGGDEVEKQCWDIKPSIKEWMKQNNVSDYEKLSTFYRKKQKQIWRNISTTKKVIYWANQQIDLPIQNDDVVQWWGQTRNLDKLTNRSNEVILSTYDQTYLDVGFGDPNGDKYLTFIRWRQMYGFNPRYPGVNVIGGEACIWGELNNVHTHDQKVWIRASVISQRLWNDKLSSDFRSITERLEAHSRRLKARGFRCSPVTVQLCEKHPQICFN